MKRKTSRLAGIAAAFAVAALAQAGPALAATLVTQSTITTPTQATAYYIYNTTLSPTAATTVSGTTNGDSGAVDINCYYTSSSSYDTWAAGVPVNADGTFVTNDADYSLSYDNHCRLRAVPASTTPGGSDILNYSGPMVGDTYWETSTYSGGQQDYFRTGSHSLGTENEIDPVGDCAFERSYLYTQDANDYSGPWSCAGVLSGSASYFGNDSEIRVDRANAYTSYDVPDSTLPGVPAEGFTISQIEDGVGDHLMVETEPIVWCADDAGTVWTGTGSPATGPGTECAKYVSTDLTLTRTMTESHSGRTLTVADRYANAASASRSLFTRYDMGLNDSYVEFPGEGGYLNHASDSTADVGSATPGSIYVNHSPGSAGTADNTFGAVTFFSSPDGGQAIVQSSSKFILPYTRDVPAGGAVDITHEYSSAFTDAGVRALAAESRDAAVGPAVAITAPAPNTTVTSSTVVVSGTASDNVGVQSLTVNGTPTVVGPDGTWSQTISGLTPGANTITAVATDGSGNSSQASETVVYSPPDAASCTVPKVVGTTKAAAKAALVAAGCSVGNLTTKPSNNVVKGSVVKQSIASGTKVSAFYPVGLVVSSGRQGRAHLASKTLYVKHGKLIAKVVCPRADGNPCNGSMKIITSHPTNLGTQAFQAPAGKARKVFFTLSKTAKRQLAGRTTRAKVFIIARNFAGKATFTKVRVKIKG